MIELKDARHELDILEKFINNPELIMLNPLIYEKEDYSLLFGNITVDNKNIFEHLKEYLEKFEAFKNTTLYLNENNNIMVTIPSFHDYKYLDFDTIMLINLKKHTYENINRCINSYKEFMNELIIYEPYEIKDIFKRYENYTFKKRLTVAWSNLFDKDKTYSVRISDFFFSLFVSKKYLKKIFDKEYKRVEEANKCLKKRYDEDVEEQKLYRQKVPEQIRKIEQKQKEIAAYLSKYGFKEQTNY